MKGAKCSEQGTQQRNTQEQKKGASGHGPLLEHSPGKDHYITMWQEIDPSDAPGSFILLYAQRADSENLEMVAVILKWSSNVTDF